MIHNLTEKQLKALRWILEQTNNGVFEESFLVIPSASVSSPDEIRIPGIEENLLPNYVNAGALDSLAASDILVSNYAPGGATRYTLTQKADQVAVFDFANPNPDPINAYLREIYPIIQEYFVRGELEQVCFKLGIKTDWVFGDKTNWPLYLLLHLYDHKRVCELSPILEEMRPKIDWPPCPDGY